MDRRGLETWGYTCALWISTKSKPAVRARLTEATHAFLRFSISFFVISLTGAWCSFHEIGLGP